MAQDETLAPHADDRAPQAPHHPEEASETIIEPGEGENTEDISPLEALQIELAQVKDQMLRALADAENVRRRAERDKDEVSKYAVTSFARELLPVADNLRRGLEMTPAEERTQNATLNNMIEGFELTEKSLLSAFEKTGIQKIDPLHQAFDHNFHQAVFEQTSTGQPAGTITQVLQSGYVIQDRLLRPAMVAVAKDEPVKS